MEPVMETTRPKDVEMFKPHQPCGGEVGAVIRNGSIVAVGCDKCGKRWPTR